MRKRISSMLSFLTLLLITTNFAYADDTKYLIPMGDVIHLKINLEDLIVRENVESSGLEVGDIILCLDGKKVLGKECFDFILSHCSNNGKIEVVVLRDDKSIKVVSSKKEIKKAMIDNKFGGFATLTYIDIDTMTYGAVAHNTKVGNYKNVRLNSGEICTSKDIIIEKSRLGKVGYLKGSKGELVGDIEISGDCGINGNINGYDIQSRKEYKVASLEEIKLGKAQIIFKIDGCSNDKYDIAITDIERKPNEKTKTIKYIIIDHRLIKETGGIVQGMSGSPIIQDNKIIGGVSCVVESNPAIGYGSYIKDMFPQ